jgi:hypothetical protein
LQHLIANSSASFTDVIPVLPPIEGIQVFWSQIRISVFYPITAKGLPETEVLLTTINFLNRLASADFTPDLARMDDMIKSLRVAEPMQ